MEQLLEVIDFTVYYVPWEVRLDQILYFFFSEEAGHNKIHLNFWINGSSSLDTALNFALKDIQTIWIFPNSIL